MWFYTKDKKTRFGPYSFQQLQTFARSGYLAPGDMVQQPTGAWVPAASIPALFQVVSPPVPLHVPFLTSDQLAKLRSVPPLVWVAAGFLGLAMFVCCGLAGFSNLLDPSPSQLRGKDRGASGKQASESKESYPVAECFKPDGSQATIGDVKKHEEKFGPKPMPLGFSHYYKEVEVYLKDALNDPDSLEYVKWSMLVMADNGWEIRLKYRGKNAFGGVITKDEIFTVKQGKVVAVRDGLGRW